MGVRSEGNGHRDVWKLLIGLSVACAVLVFVGGFLHRRALDSAVADRQAKSVAFVNTKVADAAKHTDLGKPLKDPAAAQLTKQLDLPAGTDLRLFSNTGAVVYSSPGLAVFPADAEGLQSAASGDPAHVVDGADLRVYAPVDGNGAKPVAIAAVVSNYTQLRDDAAGPLDGMRLPIVALGVVLLVAGLLLMLQATKGSAAGKASAATPQPSAPKAKAPSSAKRRVTGFDPVPVTTGPTIQRVEVEEEHKAAAVVDPTTVAPAPVVAEAAPPATPTEPAAKTVFGLRLGSKKPKEPKAAPAEPAGSAAEAEPPATKAKRSLFSRKEAVAEPAVAADVPADKAASALDREIAIRQALEDQLEQLRTRMQMQDVEAASTKKELLAELEAANARAEEAEARARDAGAAPAAASAPQVAVPAAVPDETAMRVQQLEREVAEARSVSNDAVARAEALQRQLDEAKAAPAADPAAAAKLAEATAQLSDAQQRASAAEQRAASVESVRDELEVRVAQLGTKASELEQRATELETSLNEANAGGDAVRAEIATLTAALAAANARVSELESAPPTPARNEEDETEIARLRGELADHLERAQAAESRVATLEADLSAAEHRVATTTDTDADDPTTNGVASVAAVDRLASRFDIAEEAAPEVSEPEVSEPEVSDPEVTSRSSVPETNEPDREDAAEADVATEQAASDGSMDPQEQVRTFEPMKRLGSATASAVDATEDEPSAGGLGSGVSEPEPPATQEIREPEPATDSAPAEPANPEKTSTVEWHAPAPAPQAVQPFPQPAASSNGEIPPAPSSDARYDDMWTAAFVPPEPAVQPDPEPQPEPARTEPSEPENPDVLPAAPAESGSSTPESTVSPDDQPSPPEDELSAEDDMWSLRARLEAASRKQTHGMD